MTLSRPRAALLAVLLAAVLVAAAARSALSAPALPEVAPEELLASVLEAAADPPPVSGELSATIGLGLPELPTEPGEDSLADVLGDSRLRVEHSDDGHRIALLGEHSERLLVTDGETLTSWDSRTMQVVRWQLPDRAEDEAEDHLASVDPRSLARAVVARLDERAAVSVDGTARIAGRSAYRLVVAPDDPGTTLGRAELDIDADTRTPLRTALFARGAAAPSVEVAFTSVSFAPIDPSVFEFTPPPGAEVTEHDLSDWPTDADHPGMWHPGLPHHGRPDGDARRPRIVGEGWTAVAVLPLPPGSSEGALPEEAAALLPLNGPLLSVRQAEAADGPVLLTGLVPLSRLDEVAADLR